MITGFDKIVYKLTDDERKMVIPMLIRGLQTKTGKVKAITNKKMVAALKEHGVKTSGPRIRKMIHAIRCEGIIPNLVSTSTGYYITKDIKEMNTYIQSLNERLQQIKNLRDAMVLQRTQWVEGRSTQIKLFNNPQIPKL